MKFLDNKKAGFTLIELLVVIGIIAILSAILYANFSQARMIARDKARLTTLKEMQLALELYKAQNGEYPEAGCGAAEFDFAGPGIVISGSNFVSCTGNNEANYIVGLVPDYIAELPQDPLFEDEPGRGYYYRSDGTSYKFMVLDSVEVNAVDDWGHEFARCPGSGGECGSIEDISTTYAVYSAGAEQW